MKDIFVSKIKRLAVAIFAALCVGSAWGQVVLEVNQPLVIKSDGTLEVSYTILYYGTSSLRNFDFEITYNEEGLSQTTTQTVLEKHPLQGKSGTTYNNPVTYSSTYTLTGLDPAKVYVIDFKTWGVKTTESGPNWSGDNWWEIKDVYTTILSGISSAEATLHSP